MTNRICEVCGRKLDGRTGYATKGDKYRCLSGSKSKGKIMHCSRGWI